MDVQFEEDNIAKNYSANRGIPQMPKKSLSQRDVTLIIVGILAIILTIYILIK